MELKLSFEEHYFVLGQGKIDWNGLKRKWDENPLFFRCVFKHNENVIAVKSELYKKQYKLSVYINGYMKGEYMDKEHPLSIYLHKKELKPNKRIKELYRQGKILAKIRKEKWKEPKPYYLHLPIFDNMAQVKRMIENLPKL